MKKIKTFSAKALSLICAAVLILTAVIIPSAVNVAAEGTVSCTFNALGGTINKNSVTTRSVPIGDILPFAYKADGAFQGWYLDTEFSQPAGKVADASLSGKTLYAKYGEGVTIDFDHGEAGVRDSTDKYLDTNGDFTTDTENGYRIFSSFKGEFKNITNTTDYVTQALTVNDAGNNNWLTAGGYVFNSNSKAVKVEAGNTYRVTYNVYLVESGNVLANSFVQLGTNPTWNQKGAGKIDAFKTKYANTGVQLTAGSNDYTYYVDGVAKQGTAGKWYTASDVITVDNFATATETNPLPDVLGFYGQFCGGSKRLYIDDVVIECIKKAVKVTYTLDALDGTVNNKKTLTSTATAEGLVLPGAYKEGFAFAGWYFDKAFTEPASGYIDNSINGKTLYAKYAEGVTMNFDHGEASVRDDPEKYLDTNGDFTNDTENGYRIFSSMKGQTLNIGDATDYVSKAFSLGKNTNDNYQTAGGLVFNDGKKAVLLEAGRTYKVTYKIYYLPSRTLNTDSRIRLGYNPVWSQAGPGVIQGVDSVFQNSGVRLYANSEELTYYVDGVAKQGTSGNWYICSDTIKIDKFATPTATTPLPNALGFAGEATGGQKYLYIDDINIEAMPLTCGENVTWAYADGKLTISGSGDMDSYEAFADTPWAKYADSLNLIVVDGDVTLSKNAFKGLACPIFYGTKYYQSAKFLTYSIPLTGWQIIEGNKYYFKVADGEMMTGTAVIGGKAYSFGDNGILLGNGSGFVEKDGITKYYVNGVYQTKWQEIGGNNYYFKIKTGEMVTGTTEIGGKAYSFDDNGILLGNGNGFAETEGVTKYFVDGVYQTKWQEIDGNKYYFKVYTGEMVTGDVTIGGKLYHFTDDGKLIA